MSTPETSQKNGPNGLSELFASAALRYYTPFALLSASLPSAASERATAMESDSAAIRAHYAGAPAAPLTFEHLEISRPDSASTSDSLAQEILQKVIAAGVKVHGKAKWIGIPIPKSGDVGYAEILHLSRTDCDALYIHIDSQDSRVPDLRFCLPVRNIGNNRFALLGNDNEVMLEFPANAEITMLIRPKHLDYHEEKTTELESQIEVKHTQDDGSEIEQKLKIIPLRLYDQDGYKRKDVRVEFERKEKPVGADDTKINLTLELQEPRSEDFEGRPGGPPVFIVEKERRILA